MVETTHNTSIQSDVMEPNGLDNDNHDEDDEEEGREGALGINPGKRRVGD